MRHRPGVLWSYLSATRTALVVTGLLALAPAAAHAETVPGQLVISEFRLQGPNGLEDEFIELHNATGSPVVAQASDGSAGLGVAASDGVLRCTVPNGTNIPPHGHFLCARSGGYSLANYGGTNAAAPNATYANGIATNAGIALFNSSTSFGSSTRLDAAGASTEANVLYREGPGYAAVPAVNANFSLARRLETPGSTPLDTNNNATDFRAVAADANTSIPTASRGAPGPETLASPVAGTPTLGVGLVSTCMPVGAPPNLVRFLGSPDTLSIRRRITNNTGAPVTRLRFRVAELSTWPEQGPTAAILSATTSSFSSEARPSCDPPGPSLSINALTLEQPPAQPDAGGVNSSLSAGTVNVATPLAPGASIDVSFLFTIIREGTVKICINAESLPVGGTGPVGLGGELRSSPAYTDGCPLPASAGGLAATAQAEAVALDWSDSAGATSYDVFRRDADGSYPSTPTASPTSSAFTDVGRTAGTNECYVVRAANASGFGGYSDEACATPTLGSVGGLAATGQTGAVALDWSDSAGATGYDVFRRNPDGSYPSTPTASPTASGHVDSGLAVGTEYCYRVRAVNATQVGPLSDEACATTAPSAPGPISGLVASARVRAVALDWADTAGASSYDVFRRGLDGTYPALATATVQASELLDPGRSPGVTECYRVRARNESGVGPLSDQVCATPTSHPIAQTLDLSSIPSRVRVNRRRFFTIRFKGTPDTRGSIVIKTVRRIALPSAKRIRTLVRRRFTSPESGSVRLRLRLGRKHMAAVRRAGRLRVRATVELGSLTKRRKFSLVPPKRRR